MKKRISFLPTVLLALLVAFGFVSCQKEELVSATSENSQSANSKVPVDPGFAENDMVMYWNEKVSTVLQAPMPMPFRARLFAIMEIAVHDALNSIKPKYQRYALTDVREPHASPDAAVASAAYHVIIGLNQQRLQPVGDWYNESLASIPDGESKELGKALGKKAADAIIALRANDGLGQVIFTSTIPADGDEPGEYRSTLPYQNPAIFIPPNKSIPNWGVVMKPFAVESNDQFRPDGPYSVQSAEYAADFNEVKTKGARVGHTRTAEEEEISVFWKDLTSHIWNRFARAMISDHKLDAWKTARVFALMHTSMKDGITAAIESKYHFYTWRPETAIRMAETDNNAATGSLEGWLPSLIDAPNAINHLFNFITPPLPEYPSSFAAMSGAGAQALKLVFGSDAADVELTSAALPGVTRHYTSILQASRDNAMGKVYAGWYFRKGVLDGENQGMEVAEYIFNNHFGESED
ncbi:hypothetical protein MD537_07075 [Flavihumibacter sediminis]|nr:hypothetical protein [Flavihumibacter sediminis]